MTLTNLCRSNEIGANSFLVEMPGASVVLDTGMHPRVEGEAGTPKLGLLRNKKVQSIIVSHAHLDHLGALPLLMRQQPDARVFMTEPTYFIGQPLLHNSASIMKKRFAERATPNQPLFTHHEVDEIVKRWQACHLNQMWSLEGHRHIFQGGISLEMFDAGHILGSAGVLLRHPEKTVFYTGDINFTDQEICRRASFPESGIDTLIIETTRGTTAAPAGYSRQSEWLKLAERIAHVFERGGSVLIPVFALGKTQEALHALHRMITAGNIPPSTIYIGGMSWKLTQWHDKLVQNLNLFDRVKPQLMDGRQIRRIQPRSGQIYLISSGMMTENTLSHMLAQTFLADKRHGIFFIGYTDPESPAGRLRAAAAAGEPVRLSESPNTHPIKCDVGAFDLTAHAQREDLLDYILKVSPKHVVLTHGDPPAKAWFAETLKSQRPKLRVTVIAPEETVEL